MYTIIWTELQYGQMVLKKNKDQVKEECERLRKISKIADADRYIRIEVMNDETGEIREYWNNKQNETLF